MKFLKILSPLLLGSVFVLMFFIQVDQVLAGIVCGVNNDIDLNRNVICNGRYSDGFDRTMSVTPALPLTNQTFNIKTYVHFGSPSDWFKLFVGGEEIARVVYDRPPAGGFWIQILDFRYS